MAEFKHEQRLACPAETLFDFLSRPANVLRLSRPESKLTFVSAPEVLESGSEIEFEVHAYGMSQSVVHQIVAVERPRRILERMLHGPLEDLEHEHLFEANGRETLLVDVIRFEPPRGLLGLLLTEERLRRSFEQSFDFRRQALEELVARGELE